MSRSFKRTPIHGITKCESEKQDKQKANRLFRRMNKISIAKGKDSPIHLKEVSDVWKFGKDGKRYDPDSTHFRK